MKKRVILVTTAVSIVLGASYLVCGRIIQKTYFQNIAQLNSNREFKINLTSYRAGLFSSEAKLELQLDTGAKNNQKKISLKQHIGHGPLVIFNTTEGLKIKIAAAKVTTTLSDELEAVLSTYTNTKQPVAVITVIRFDNTAHSWLKLSAAPQNSNSQTNLFWKEIVGTIEHDLRLNSYQGNISVPAFTYENEEHNFNVQDLAMYFDAGLQQDGRYHNNVINSRTISYSKKRVPELRLDNINCKLDFSSNNQYLNINLALSIPEAEIMQQHFANDTVTLQISNINPINIPKIGFYNSINLKTAIEILQQITAAKESSMRLEVPKHFTNMFLSYISYEMYRGSIIGKYDRRPEFEIRQDITASINNLIQSVLRQKLFVENGNQYALNFEANSKNS